MPNDLYEDWPCGACAKPLAFPYTYCPDDPECQAVKSRREDRESDAVSRTDFQFEVAGDP